MGRIAVTGTASFLGARVLRRLVEEKGAAQVVAVDIAAPPAALGIRHRYLDFTQPASDQHLLDGFRQDEIDTVVHMAFFTNPQRDTAYSHELESIGTLSVLAAAAAAGVRHVVLRSFTAVYGARGQNPNFLTEDRPLHANHSLAWARDKHEAEQHAAAIAKRYPEMKVTVLRFAPLLGPEVDTFYTAILDRRVVPVLMGFSPLVQLLHPDDAVAAALLAVERAPGGAFNIVPRGAVPLVSMLHTALKVPFPVPHLTAYPLAELLWASGLGVAPSGFLDYVRYPFEADGEKAQRVMGFTARHSSREALAAYLRFRHPERPEHRAEATA